MLAVGSDSSVEEVVSEIPVKNAWYLLLYAWDLVSWKDQWKGNVETSPHLLGLLAKILAETTLLLMRKQLRRGYESHHEKIRGIRGKIDFAASLKRRSFEKGAAHCSFYELTVDTLKNSIIRSTIRRLSNDPRVYHHNAKLDADLKHQLKTLDLDLVEVSTKRIESSDFSRLQLTRNDQDYSLPISICYLIHRLEMPTEDMGDHALKALLRDEVTFHKLFELFVCNFYRYHLTDCEVGYQKQLSWFDELNCPFMPSMQTDITLVWPEPPRRLVIDTKYYLKTLTSSPYGSQKFKSENLYQLYTYLRTQEHRGDSFANAQGMLLYPTTNHQLTEPMLVQGHKITVATVDLAEPWENIENRLLSLVGN
jgi:5-methylcytosine-specific restriction enzyme subunit McrC